MDLIDLRTLDLAWLARTERVHRQLRPQLPADYAAKMARVYAAGGRMVVAAEGEAVRGLAVWRSAENTFAGIYMYIDDLVTDETQRSSGVGRAVLRRCEDIARELGCTMMILDSGTPRVEAHRFYFRERYGVHAFNFTKRL